MNLLEQVLVHLGVVVLKADDKDGFSLESKPLPWFQRLFCGLDGKVVLPNESSFMELFLDDARSFWEAGLGGSVKDGPWVESDGTDEFTLTAEALPGGILLIRYDPHQIASTQETMQTARETMLRNQRLENEVLRKRTP